MRALIAISQVPFARRRTEVLAEQLQRALRSAGHLAEIIRFPFCGSSPESVLSHILASRLLDLTQSGGDILIALEFPAYLIRHPNKVLWVTHRYCPFESATRSLAGSEVPTLAASASTACAAADRRSIREARRVYSISATASCQLRRLSAVDAVPLYPPPTDPQDFFCDQAGEYLLVPTGAHPSARLELVLEAAALTREPARLRLCADPTEDLLASAERLEVQDRLEWLGGVKDAELPGLYACCQAVLYPAYEDTFARTALHAMLASKPMITCSDSGAPAELVRHRETGWISEPAPGELASAIDDLWRDPIGARARGAAARRLFDSLDLEWSTVLEKLLA